MYTMSGRPLSETNLFTCWDDSGRTCIISCKHFGHNFLRLLVQNLLSPPQSPRRDHEPTTGRAAWGLEAGTAGNDAARRVEHEFAQARPPPWRRRVAPTLLRAMHHKLRHGRAAHDATHRLASHVGTGIGHAYGS